MSRHIAESLCLLLLGSMKCRKDVSCKVKLPFVKRIHFKQQTPSQEQFYSRPKQDPIFMNYQGQCRVRKGVRDLTCNLAAQDQPWLYPGMEKPKRMMATPTMDGMTRYSSKPIEWIVRGRSCTTRILCQSRHHLDHRGRYATPQS